MLLGKDGRKITDIAAGYFPSVIVRIVSVEFLEDLVGWMQEVKCVDMGVVSFNEYTVLQMQRYECTVTICTVPVSTVHACVHVFRLLNCSSYVSPSVRPTSQEALYISNYTCHEKCGNCGTVH